MWVTIETSQLSYDPPWATLYPSFDEAVKAYVLHVDESLGQMKEYTDIPFFEKMVERLAEAKRQMEKGDYGVAYELARDVWDDCWDAEWFVIQEV